jgi:hypothetical protein
MLPTGKPVFIDACLFQLLHGSILGMQMAVTQAVSAAGVLEFTLPYHSRQYS